MYRIAFSPALSVVAASPFMAAGHSFLAGAPVAWRELGITEQTLYDWWRCGLVSHPVEAQAPPPVAVETPKPTKQPRASR